MNALMRQSSRFFICQAILHFIFYLFCSNCNYFGANSLTLWWTFFALQNFVSFGYICDSRRRLNLRDEHRFRTFNLLHVICCFYGFFGVVLAMKIIPHHINATGFAYKILCWAVLNHLTYSFMWNYFQNYCASC